MRRNRWLAGAVLVSLTSAGLTPAEAAKPDSDRGCSAGNPGLDIVDGDGRITRSSLVSLPTGTAVDLDGTLEFTMVLGGASCADADYELEVYGTSPLPLVGPRLRLLGSQTRPGTGATALVFSVSYRDDAALRDPVDVNGSDRCVFVVGTVHSRGVVRDRAPDVGTFTVCPGDVVITQPPFA